MSAAVAATRVAAGAPLGLPAIAAPAAGSVATRPALALAPVLFALYPLLLWRQLGDPLAFLRAQDVWSRELSRAGPLGGLWDGLRAGVAGVRQLVSGSHAESFWPVLETDPMRAAALNLQTLAFLLLFLALSILVWRRFGAPYGLFAALSVALPLSVPTERWPLLSLPRFGLVVFPLFLALAALGARPRVHTAIVSVSAIFLGIAVTQWALWQWVA